LHRRVERASAALGGTDALRDRLAVERIGLDGEEALDRTVASGLLQAGKWMQPRRPATRARSGRVTLALVVDAVGQNGSSRLPNCPA
jgi:hypothetical protein